MVATRGPGRQAQAHPHPTPPHVNSPPRRPSLPPHWGPRRSELHGGHLTSTTGNGAPRLTPRKVAAPRQCGPVCHGYARSRGAAEETRPPWRSCRLDRGRRLPVGTAVQGRGARGLGKEGFLEEVTVSHASQDEEGSSMRSRMCSDATRSRVAVSAAGVGTEQSARREWTGVDAAGPRSPGRAVLWPCPQGLRGRHCPAQQVTFTCAPCGDGRVPRSPGRPRAALRAGRVTGSSRKPVLPKPPNLLKHALTWDTVPRTVNCNSLKIF